MRFYTTLWNINVRKNNDDNKNVGKWKNASDQHCDEWFVWHLTVLYPHSPVSYKPFAAMLVWSVFLSISSKCLFVIIVMYAYFIDISQGSVETHLRCGGIYNNYAIANCLQSALVKEFRKSVNNWRRCGQK